MGVTEQRMEQLGITLQQTDWRGKGAVEAVLAGDMLYISAHYPVDENGTPVYVGRVGAEIDEAAAYQAARLCGLNMLRTIQAYIGSLDRVERTIRSLGKKEVEKLRDEDPIAEVNCQFCGKQYKVDLNDLLKNWPDTVEKQ